MIKSHHTGDLQLWTCSEQSEYDALAKKGEIVYTLEECQLGQQMDTELKQALLRMKSTLPSVRVLKIGEAQ